VALGRALRADAAVEPALRGYEGERRGTTAALLARGRRAARLMRMTSPAGCALRELAIRLIPVTALTRLAAGISRRAGTDWRREG
jgi:2-polyprenyl-6-methoxyphenol hydroxylase-like FAD-dependent oxidoreductase